MLEQLKGPLSFAIEFSEAIFRASEDNKIDLTDLFEFKRSLFLVGDALQGFKEIPALLRSMEEPAMVQLQAEVLEYVKSEFDIPDDKLERRIEGAINLIMGLAIYAGTF